MCVTRCHLCVQAVCVTRCRVCVQALQRFIESFQYNYTGDNYFNLKKGRPLHQVGRWEGGEVGRWEGGEVSAQCWCWCWCRV